MPIKIALVGAGAVGWTRKLLRDLLTVPEFVELHYALTDISEVNLDMAHQLCVRDVSENRLPAKIEKTMNRRQAFEGADYIICAIRQGGLEAFATDIDIPLKYGIDQCVGDTICAGGIMYAQRTIPVLLDFCRDIREVAKPRAWFLNYSNPMAMNTWACNVYGGVFTIGLCHGVQGAHWQITKAVELWAKKKGLIRQDEKLHRNDVQVVAAGLNHQTWFTQINFRGHDMVPILPEIFGDVEEHTKREKVRIDVLKRFGYYSTESSGHLSEYLPWYRKRTGRINDWIDTGVWIDGETGGYLRICTEGRNWFETDFPNWLKEPVPKFAGEGATYERSEEHGSYIIEARETGRTYRGHFNVMNRGHISNLPDACCIEIPGYVDRNGLHMPVVGDLPLGCAATCSVSANVQKICMEAAVKGDVNLLKLAMLHDPLVGAVCEPEEVWQMTDEMLIAQAQWLPQYQEEIPRAIARLAAHERGETRVKRIETRGAARKPTRSVTEMSSEKEQMRKLAGETDRGKLMNKG